MRGIDELDHYELLEVGRAASASEIDRAYRNAQNIYQEGSLALYSVFDRLDAATIRERLDEAYRVLADTDLRAQYDEALPAAGARTGALDPRPEVVAGGVDAATAPDSLSGFDPAEQLDSVDQAVEEFDALEDDGRGEFDGVRLRRNRLFRGYEIDDISDVTKVSPAHLRNIEEENFGDLPADVYVRGFVTAYAQTIGLDPKIVVPSYMARVQESRNAQQRGGFLARR
ncbi:MAG: helix-turn-helix domain-containing protein [Myxococcota bacterium]